MTTTRSTMTCKCGVILATWDNRINDWLPPIREADRIHTANCPQRAHEARRTA